MKSLFHIVIVICFAFISCEQTQGPANNEENIFPYLTVKNALDEAAYLMDEARMTEAQNILLNTLQNDSLELSNADKYYLNSFLAEIMYYSALFDQGINYSRRAKDIAIELKNEPMQGSSDNFLGLFYLNKNFIDSAIVNFKNALELIGDNDTTLWLSRRYHVYNNLGETYLKLKQADSVRYYTNKAIKLCEKDNVPRAYALGMWNLSELSIIEKDVNTALSFADKGLKVTGNQESLNDVRLFLLGSKMKAYATDSNKEKILTVFEESKQYLNTRQVSIYSKVEFLKATIQSLLFTNQFAIASPLQTELRNLEEKLKSEEDISRIQILNNYYQNEQKLLLIRKEKEKQELTLFLTNSLNIALAALFIVCLALVFFIRFNSNQKAKIQLLAFEAEKEELKRIQEIKSMKSNFESLQNERNRIAKELHDDIGSSLSSISIFTSLAIEAFPDKKEKAEDLMQRVKSQASYIADNLSDLIWAVYSKNDTYGHLIIRMKNFCYEILNEKNIQTDFYFDPKIQDVFADLTIRKNLIQFFKEAINNILKYSEASHIEVSLKEHDGYLRLDIIDNGIGFDPNTVMEGNGFTSFRARAKAMNGKMNIHSQPGKGTQVWVEFELALLSIDEKE